MIYGTEENRNETECAGFVLKYLEKQGAQARITLNKGCINTICLLNGKTDRLQMSNGKTRPEPCRIKSFTIAERTGIWDSSTVPYSQYPTKGRKR